MLAIRMQRTGRSGHAQFRLVVQDSRRTPTSGKFVALLGHFNPHSKTVVIEKEKAKFYLEHGAQPSPRVALILKNEGVKLPKWVELPVKKKASVKNTDKLRKNRPAEMVAKPDEPDASTEETTAATAQTEELVADSNDGNNEDSSQADTGSATTEVDANTEVEAADSGEQKT